MPGKQGFASMSKDKRDAIRKKGQEALKMSKKNKQFTKETASIAAYKSHKARLLNKLKEKENENNI
jgi:hypothetical protein